MYFYCSSLHAPATPDIYPFPYTTLFRSFLAPRRLDRIDNALIVPSVDGGAFDARHAVQNVSQLGDKWPPHFLRGSGHDNGHFECEHRSCQSNDVVLELQDVDVTNASVQTDLVIHQE